MRSRIKSTPHYIMFNKLLKSIELRAITNITKQENGKMLVFAVLDDSDKYTIQYKNGIAISIINQVSKKEYKNEPSN